MYGLPLLLREACSAPRLVHVADCIHIVPEVWDACYHCGISKSPTQAQTLLTYVKGRRYTKYFKIHYRHNDLREDTAALGI
jgi:hypothetical protein